MTRYTGQSRKGRVGSGHLGKKVRNERNRLLLVLRHRGWSLRELGLLFGISHAHVGRLLADLGRGRRKRVPAAWKDKRCERCGAQAVVAVQDIERVCRPGTMVVAYMRHGGVHYFCKAHERDSHTYEEGRRLDDEHGS